jgi:hypothetical protein
MPAEGFLMKDKKGKKAASKSFDAAFFVIFSIYTEGSFTNTFRPNKTLDASTKIKFYFEIPQACLNLRSRFKHSSEIFNKLTINHLYEKISLRSMFYCRIDVHSLRNGTSPENLC